MNQNNKKSTKLFSPSFAPLLRFLLILETDFFEESGNIKRILPHQPYNRSHGKLEVASEFRINVAIRIFVKMSKIRIVNNKNNLLPTSV